MPDGDPLLPDDPAELGGYRLAGRLGEGSQGVVYLGRDSMGTRVAVKLLHARMAADPGARDRFVRELSAAKKVARFCTAQVLDADLAGDHPYIVSEYVDGRSLRSHVTADGPHTGGTLERLAIGTLTALAAIHRAGIVHRDFTPHNVLLGPDGPRVIDFGIARALNVACEEETHSVGTPAYMSPEQVTAGRVGPPADMFAWGATILFAGTGRPPFGNESVPAVMERVLHTDPDVTSLPEPLRSVVSSCLAKDPAARPTAQQAQAALLGHDAAVALMPPPAFGSTPEPPPASSPNRGTQEMAGETTVRHDPTGEATVMQGKASPGTPAEQATTPTRPAGKPDSERATTGPARTTGKFAATSMGPTGKTDAEPAATSTRPTGQADAERATASAKPADVERTTTASPASAAGTEPAASAGSAGETGVDPAPTVPAFAPPAFPMPGIALPGAALPPPAEPAAEAPDTASQNPTVHLMLPTSPGPGMPEPTTFQLEATVTGPVPGLAASGPGTSGPGAGPVSSNTDLNATRADLGPVAWPPGAVTEGPGTDPAAFQAGMGAGGPGSGLAVPQAGAGGSVLSPAASLVGKVTGVSPRLGRRWMVLAVAGVAVAGVILAIPLWPGGGGDTVSAPKTRPASVSESPTPTATARIRQRATGVMEAAPAKPKPPPGCKDYSKAYTVAKVGTVRIKVLVCRGGFTGTAVTADVAPKDAYAPCVQLRGHVKGPEGTYISTQVISATNGKAVGFKNGPKFRFGSKTKRTEDWVTLNAGRCTGTAPAWQSHDKLATG